MNSSEIAKKINEILSVLLERVILENEEVVLSQEEAWHSIKLIELIFLLEESFMVKLAPEEIALFDRSSDLIKFFENKLSSQR